MRELHVFSGVGGGIIGGMLLGHTTVCAVELNHYRRKVLLQRQRDGILPKFPVWDDARTFNGDPWCGRVDVVAGGFPCQDISAANPFATGITGERSGLWKEMRRIIHAVRPPIIFVENSPMLTIRGLGVVLGDLAAMGFDGKWGVLGADDCGGYHPRKRVFILGYSNDLRKLQQERRIFDQRGRIGDSGIKVADTYEVRSNGRGFSEGSNEILEWSEKAERQHNAVAVEGCNLPMAGDWCWSNVQFIRCTDEKTRATKPGLRGMAHGVADRLDRVAAIGDGQVPAVVALAWRMLSKGLQ